MIHEEVLYEVYELIPLPVCQIRSDIRVDAGDVRQRSESPKNTEHQ